MANEKKFLDETGVKYLWEQLSMEDYPNNETLMAVITAIDEIKANKEELAEHNSSPTAHIDIRNELDMVKIDAYGHFNKSILSEDGIHNIRFNKEKYRLELFYDNEWHKLPTPKKMTLSIDLSNSNPETCCTYADDATELAAGSAEWDEFFEYYPVLMKDGKEIVRLDPNDFSKDINGNDVDIASGDAGDVMIAFPRKGLNISTSGNIITVSFTSDSNNPNFKYYAHQYNGNELNKFYIGAYEGFLDDNGALRSLSGKEPTTNISLIEAREAARKNGDRYEQFAFYQLLYMQCIYLMKYKSLDCQTALGRGRVRYDSTYDNDSDKKPAITGTMNTAGLDYGTQTGYDGVKFAGVEHTWGSCYKWLDGCQTDSARNYQLTTSNFGSTDSSNYITVETTFTSNTSGYLRTPVGTSECGFLSNGSGGSATTYFADMQFCNASRFANCGGSWDVNDMGGIFLVSFYDRNNESKEHVCGRLIKL